jgi:hypothetical protein
VSGPGLLRNLPVTEVTIITQGEKHPTDFLLWDVSLPDYFQSQSYGVTAASALIWPCPLNEL